MNGAHRAACASLALQGEEGRLRATHLLLEAGTDLGRTALLTRSSMAYVRAVYLELHPDFVFPEEPTRRRRRNKRAEVAPEKTPRWTPAEDHEILNPAGRTNRELAEAFGRSPNGISQRRARLRMMASSSRELVQAN